MDPHRATRGLLAQAILCCLFLVLNPGTSRADWTQTSGPTGGTIRSVLALPNGSRVLAGTENDIFRTDNLGDTWVDTQSGTNAWDFATNPNGASGVSLFAVNSPAGIYKSIDDGATWAASSNGLGDFDVNSIGAVPNGSGGTNLLAGTCTELYISTDDGASWGPANLQTLILDYAVTPNESGGHDIWAGGHGGVWLSTNGGIAWTPRNPGIEGMIVQGLATTVQGKYTFAAVNPYGVYHSTNGGLTWLPANNHLYDLHIVTLLSPDGTNLFAGGTGGVYLSTDHGANWSNVSAGLTTGVSSLALSQDGSTLLAGTSNFGVWRRPLAEMLGTVAVEPGAEKALALLPNHPNPFEAGTTIQYSLPRAMPVRLVIYDVTGRAVRTLVDGVEAAGDRQAIWDGRDETGSAVGAGMYVYRLEADGVRLARKMARLR